MSVVEVFHTGVTDSENEDMLGGAGGDHRGCRSPDTVGAGFVVGARCLAGHHHPQLF
jgi:hypothetical protein